MAKAVKTKKTAKKSKITDLVLGTWKGQRVWYITHGRRKTRTSFGPADRPNAEVAREAYEAKLKRAMPSIGQVAVTTVISWAKQSAVPSARSGLATMDRLFGNLPAGAITQVRIDALIDQRWIIPETGEIAAPHTAAQYARTLVKALGAYADAHTLAGAPKIIIKALPRNQDERVLEKAEIGRILWACLGWRWLPAGGFIAYPQPERARVRRTRRPLLRAIIIMFGSGSSLSCARRLAWHPSPDGKRSYVDLEGLLLHRLGPDEPGRSKLRVSVPISIYLQRHLKSWALAAAPSDELIVPHVASTKLHLLFRQACEDAGVQNATLEMVARSFGALSLSEGSTVRSVSTAVGIFADAVQERLGEYANNFQESVVRAFLARPKSIS